MAIYISLFVSHRIAFVAAMIIMDEFVPSDTDPMTQKIIREALPLYQSFLIMLIFYIVLSQVVAWLTGMWRWAFRRSRSGATAGAVEQERET